MIPYAPRERFTQPNRLSDLILRSGDAQADAHLRSGQIWGNTIGKLGNIASGYVEDRAAQKQEQAQAAELSRRDQAALAVMSNPDADPLEFVRIYGPREGIKVAQGFEAFKKIGAGHSQSPEDLFKLYGGLNAVGEKVRAAAYPTIVANVSKAIPALAGALPQEYSAEGWKEIGSLLGGMNPAKPGEGFTLGQGQVRFGPDGKQIAAGPVEAPKPEQPRVVGRSLVGPDGKVIYRDPDAPKEDNEPLVPVMGDDGQPVLMRRSQAEGRRPASTREQGRPVTSGDAGRIAELDTSLDDLKALKNVLGTTGAGSQVGAMLPNVVTEVTGLGSDSKQRQAMIDRVKQVIGKALEGGVLRKEDEAKYEKILPRIGDPPDVAKTKLANLEAAIEQRRTREIEAREDAGYDVSKFKERGRKPAANNQPAAPQLVKYQGKMVPFASLPADMQALVLANSGGKP